MRALKNVSNEATRKAWLEVDLAALRANCRTLMQHLPEGCRILPMVKADGYGLGVETVVATLAPLNPWGFGVATAVEGREVRSLGWDQHSVVFAPGLPEDVPALLTERLESAISGLEALISCANRARGLGAALPVHLEVDTGMGRFGLPWHEARVWAPEVRRILEEGGVHLVGTFTHFHSADVDASATREQWRRFSDAVGALRTVGLDPGLIHAANSAGAMLCDDVQADLVRPGIYLYGGGRWEPAPRPVVSVRARVLDVRAVPAGTTVGYGATYTTPAPARLATLAIGYGDGLRRELSNRGVVLIGGREAPIRGVVCMDSIVADVTDHGPVAAGHLATVLGREGPGEIGLEAMAETCGTIGYEILTGWSKRLPRFAVNDTDR
jgi:alanine racemase